MSADTTLRIGAHVDQADPVAEASVRGAALAQFFLGDPQSYRGPEVRYAGGAAGLRTDAERAGLDLFVHAPYIVNVASSNNRIRIPSRKLLERHARVAADIGAKGLIVHGGHLVSGEDRLIGVDNWCKTLERRTPPLPILIENTAGGGNAVARRLDGIARLWEALATRVDMSLVGFCLDTCHAHAGGEELAGIVDRVKAITGRVDLVHANDSRDAFDSGADRHANLGAGAIDPDAIVAAVQAAGAPVVCETPGGADGQSRDIAFLRERLPG